MMVWSINLFVLAIGLLIIGMIKPQWILFWMEKPGRMPIFILSVVLFMTGAVMFGEANLEKKNESAEETLPKNEKNVNESEVPKLQEE
jgi:hypothetical protein